MDSDIRHPCRFFGAIDCGGLYCGFKDRGLNWKTCGWCNGIVKNGIEYPLEDKPMSEQCPVDNADGKCIDEQPVETVESLKKRVKNLEGKLETALVLEKVAIERTAEIERILSEEVKKLRAEKENYAGVLNTIVNTFDLGLDYDYPAICTQIKRRLDAAEGASDILISENKSLRAKLESIKHELEELKKQKGESLCHDENKFCVYAHTASLLEQVRAESDRAWRCHNELATKYGDALQELKRLKDDYGKIVQECHAYSEKSIYLEKKLLEKRTRNRTCWCVWCGEHFPLDKDTGRKMKEHVKVCKKHPMRELERKLAEACPCPYQACWDICKHAKDILEKRSFVTTSCVCGDKKG